MKVGDFALLVHSGMKVRTAVIANLLSSVFALVGLAAGLLLGSTGQVISTSQDIFSCFPKDRLSCIKILK